MPTDPAPLQLTQLDDEAGVRALLWTGRTDEEYLTCAPDALCDTARWA